MENKNIFDFINKIPMERQKTTQELKEKALKNMENDMLDAIDMVWEIVKRAPVGSRLSRDAERQLLRICYSYAACKADDSFDYMLYKIEQLEKVK